MPPHWPYSATADAVDVALVEVDVDDALVEEEEEEEVEVGLELVEPALVEAPAGDDPASGPAMLVVIVPLSTKTPDQNQSSAAAFVPPLGSRSTPTCQSSELLDGDALTGAISCLRSSEPVEYHRPTLPPLKSMSYAKLYHVLGTSWVDHCVTPPISQRRALSVVPDSPLMRPYLISVK